MPQIPLKDSANRRSEENTSVLALEFAGLRPTKMSDFSFMFVILGMIGSLAVTPMDVVKTRLQVLRNAQGEAAYSGIVDCVQKTYTNEGIMAFYKGAVPRMIVIAPLFGIAQMVYFLGVAEWMIGWEV